MKINKYIFILLFTLFYSGLFSQSKPNTDSLWNIWTNESNSDSLRLDALYDYSRAAYLFSRPDSCIYYSEIMYVFAKEKNEQRFMAMALSNQAAAYARLRDFTQARNIYSDAIAIAKNINDTLGLAVMNHGLANVCYGIGDYTKAKSYYKTSLELIISLNDLSKFGTIYNDYGNVYISIGDYEKGLELYQQHLTICQKLNDKTGLTIGYLNTGSLYITMGEYARAVEIIRKGIKVAEELNHTSYVAYGLNNLGLIYLRQGDYTKSIEIFNQSLELKEKSGDLKGMGTTLNNLGLANQKLQNYNNAIEFYNQSYKIREQTGEKSNMALVMNNIGSVYIELKDYLQAMQYLNNSLELRKEIEDKNGISSTSSNIGASYLDQKKYPLSLQYYKSAYEIAKEINSFNEIYNSLNGIYKNYCLLGFKDTSKSYLSLMIKNRLQSVENNYFTLSEREKELYYSTLENDFGKYYDYTSLYSDENPFMCDTSYNLILQNKGITLKSSTAMRVAVINSGDTSLIRKYEKWLMLKQTISKHYLRGKDAKELSDKADSIETELIKNSNAFSDFNKIKHLNWKDVQYSLKEGETAIEFIHYNSEIDTLHSVYYTAFIIKPGLDHPIAVRLCKEDELKNIISKTDGNNVAYVNEIYGTRKEAKKDLYNKIWLPLEKHLEGSKVIYFSPSGLLHKISFASLARDKDIFLCDNYRLNQMTSTGQVTFKNNTSIARSDDYFLMGGARYDGNNSTDHTWNELPGTLTETNNIYRLLIKKKYTAHLFNTDSATEENFKEKIIASQIAHVSTHGFFFPDPEQVKKETKEKTFVKDIKFRGTSNYAEWSFLNNVNPLMRSGLVLAHANDVWSRDPLAEGEDGILTAQEVSNLDLSKMKLVVLSACETGLGDIKGSEGVFGLQRAFKIAGTKYIIMSLWQVPDKETSEFMQLFYKNLLKNKNIRIAFDKTQKAMRKKYDPYFWGAFVLVE